MAAALRDPDAAQARLLTAILREVAPTRFGQTHGLSRVEDLEAYRRAVPPRGFDGFASDVERMLRGEPDVLVPGQPIFFGRTSGTSGAAKHVGYPASAEGEYLAALDPMLDAVEREHPGCLRTPLVMTGTYREATAPCGATIGSASGFVRNISAFRGEAYWHLVPEPIWELGDYEARYYAILRVALAAPLTLLNALNPSSLLTLFAKVEQYGDALVDDLRRGTLDAGPPAARALAPQLGAQLSPAPDIAEKLSASLRANGRFVPAELWPELRVIQTWKGGAAAHYLKSLRARCPGVAVRPAVSGSTEGLLATPLEGDDWMGSVPALNSSLLEFFPEDQPPESATFVPVSELDPRTGYRVLLTNRRGLYRYVMDDVFVVEGMVHRTPVIRFSHRHGLTSSLTGEKLTEPQVSDALEGAARALDLAVAEYQVAPEWGEPPRYLLMVELGADEPEPRLQALLEEFEAGLQRANLEYKAKRDSARLAPPQLLLLERGEFERVKREKAQARGGSDAQVKSPKLRRDLVERAQLRIARAVG